MNHALFGRSRHRMPSLCLHLPGGRSLIDFPPLVFVHSFVTTHALVSAVGFFPVQAASCACVPRCSVSIVLPRPLLVCVNLCLVALVDLLVVLYTLIHSTSKCMAEAAAAAAAGVLSPDDRWPCVSRVPPRWPCRHPCVSVGEVSVCCWVRC